MGVVYHALDPVIGRNVAVKTMHLSEAGTGMSREELVGRFQTEARAAGLLTHPNIVVIYDAGEEEGLFYITMELVEGRSLQSMIDARQLFPAAPRDEIDGAGVLRAGFRAPAQCGASRHQAREPDADRGRHP